MCHQLLQNKLSSVKKEHTYHRVGNTGIQEAYSGSGSVSLPRSLLDSCGLLPVVRVVITIGTSRSDNCTLGQFPRLSWKRKIHCRNQRSRLGYILRHMNLFCMHKICKIHFNIIVPSTLRSTTWSLLWSFRQKFWVNFSSWCGTYSVSTTSKVDKASRGARGSGGGGDKKKKN
jgi:hypothetical protein